MPIFTEGVGFRGEDREKLGIFALAVLRTSFLQKGKIVSPPQIVSPPWGPWFGGNNSKPRGLLFGGGVKSIEAPACKK